MDNLNPSSFCLCTVVSDKNLDSVLKGSGEGSFSDSHPWFYAKELLDEASAAHATVSILFADHSPLIFTHWAFVSLIEVVEFTGDRHSTNIRFGQLNEVNPIWESIDSVVLKPSAELLHREQIEPIRILRTHLDEAHIRPYAVCETPAFIIELAMRASHDQ